MKNIKKYKKIRKVNNIKMKIKRKKCDKDIL